MSTWRPLRIRDIARLFDGPHATPKSTKTTNSGPVFLGISSLNAGRLDLSRSSFISEEDFVQWTRRITPSEGDVVFSYETRLGEAAVIPAGFRGALGRRLALLRPDRDVVDPRFLLYSYLAPAFQEVIRQRTVPGSTVDRIMLQDFPEFPIFLPSLPEQQEIAATLGALDDTIESGRRIAAKVQELLTAMFTESFVELGQRGGVAPDGWRRGTLRDVLALVKSPTKAGAKPELPYIPIDSIPMGSLGLNASRPNGDAQSSLSLFKKNDILVGAMRVYFHRVSLAPFEGITRNTTFVLRPEAPEYLAFGLLVVNRKETIDYAQATSKGSTMPYAVWDGGLAEMPLLIPNPEAAAAFQERTMPLIEMLRDAHREAQRLSDLRETLLPELLSGRIRATEVAAAT